MKRYLLALIVLSITSGIHAQQHIITEEYMRQAKEIVRKMTLEEKLDYISGVNDFSIRAIPRLGLPEIKMADGPQGIRNNVRSTMYPSGILSAATWNRSLVNRLGRGLGKDAWAHGISFLLGPGVNIYRAPMCGRNFEYFGEDPYLAGETAKQYILGVQSEGVIATIKHFALNNQEWDRHRVSSDADERTMQEIYFATFRKAVQEAHVGAVMNSYNLLNGVHATENRWLNIDVLRNQWGFNGILMSDWESVYSGVMAALGGLDLEMPYGKFMNKANLIPAIKNGLLSESVIDLKVQHIIQTLLAFDLLHNAPVAQIVEKDIPFSRQTALDLAREGIVLLKNQRDVLPLKGTVAVLGPNADVIPTGGGSGYVNPYATVSLWQGLQALYKKKSNYIVDEVWTNPVGLSYTVSYFNNDHLSGEPSLTRTESTINHEWKDGSPSDILPKDHFSARWNTTYYARKNGALHFHISGDDGYRIFVNDKMIAADWGNHAVTSRDAFLKVEQGQEYNIKVEYYENVGDAEIHFNVFESDEAKLKALLDKKDNVVVCVGFNSTMESEGSDRSFSLDEWQKYLIEQASTYNKNTIVVVNSGGGIAFKPWIDQVQAVIMAWYPGQEGGTALAEILTGKLSPSGKLPISIEEKWEDNPVYNSYYDNRNTSHKRVLYSEGVFVGYRGYGRNGKKPLFPFGYGLSYSSFAYTNLHAEVIGMNQVKVTFDLKNIGNCDASEIIQVYVRDVECSVPRPDKELKGYEKVFLKHGEKKRMSVILNSDAFAFYDVSQHRFVVEKGKYEIMVGSSSESLPLKQFIEL